MDPSSEPSAFLEYLDAWVARLSIISLNQAIPDPVRTAILSIDVTNGFCKQGALFSARVAGIVNPIVQLFERSWQIGVRHIVLLQDTHPVDAVEFATWPAHCVQGSSEAQTVGEITRLPFYDRMVVLPKNSISPDLHTVFPGWLDEHPDLDTFIIVGDCTDLCTYQLAMYVRLEANAAQKSRRVLLPADCVDTYDLPVDQAVQLGILPHPADLIHPFFLYHLALNGVEIYSHFE